MIQSAAPLTGLRFDAETLVTVVLTLVVASVLARVVATALSAVAEHAGGRRIAVKMLVPIAKFSIYGVAAYSILGPILNLTSTQLLAVSGLVAAALGFGLKDLFAQVIGGLVLILERPYTVGDKISVGDDYGEVTDIGLRATRLVTPGDSVVSVPNDAVFASALSNANMGASEMLVVTEVHVANDADAERAAAILEEAMLTSPSLRLSDDHPVTVLVEDGPFYRTVRGKAYVNDLRDEFTFQSDVTRRTLTAFDDAGIETPAVALPERSE